jgi:transcriptional regulator with XRE-family HTH domain
MDKIEVGKKIKEVRENKGISLQQLAAFTGFSSAILSQIENHLESPSLGTLFKIAKALEVDIGEFFGIKGTNPFVITKKGEGKKVARFASKDGITRYGYTYMSLGMGKQGRKLEPFVVILEPETVKNEQPYAHEGEEFIYVLEGEVEITLGDNKDILGEGDSIYYDSSIPHLIRCIGEKAIILAVFPR